MGGKVGGWYNEDFPRADFFYLRVNITQPALLLTLHPHIRYLKEILLTPDDKMTNEDDAGGELSGSSAAPVTLETTLRDPAEGARVKMAGGCLLLLLPAAAT